MSGALLLNKTEIRRTVLQQRRVMSAANKKQAELQMLKFLQTWDVFMDAGNGNVLAFFEVPNSPAMQKDPNTPEWVQHIAFEVENMDDLLAAKSRLEAEGLDVLGPVDHTIFKSIYFFDPNGHRLELATNIAKSGMLEELHKVAPEMIAEWSQTKKAPKHAAWLHDGSFGSTEQNKQEK